MLLPLCYHRFYLLSFYSLILCEVCVGYVQESVIGTDVVGSRSSSARPVSLSPLPPVVHSPPADVFSVINI